MLMGVKGLFIDERPAAAGAQLGRKFLLSDTRRNALFSIMLR
jgi:hypothetical protein